MKICVIAPSVIPVLGLEQKYGGIEVVISVACEELTKRGHQVYLLASGDSITSAQLVPTAKKALGQDVSYETQKTCNAKAYKTAIKLKPDIIWDHTLALHAHVLHKNKSKFNFHADITLDKSKLISTDNIPVVHTMHGTASGYLPGLIHDLSVEGHYFVSISHDQAHRYTSYIAKHQHLGTVYNAVDIDYYHPKKGPKNNNFLLWVGRYCMEKGPHLALEIAHRVNLPIKLIGKRVEKHENDYFNKFIKPNMNSDDRDYGQSTTKHKAKLMREAKATLMTNLRPEPFGIVLAESMASGTSVVGPSLGSLTELIDDTGLLVDIEDLDIYEHDTKVSAGQKEYINRIVKNFSLLDKITPDIPRKRAERLFSPKHNGDGYERVFGKAIKIHQP